MHLLFICSFRALGTVFFVLFMRWGLIFLFFSCVGSMSISVWFLSFLSMCDHTKFIGLISAMALVFLKQVSDNDDTSGLSEML